MAVLKISFISLILCFLCSAVYACPLRDCSLIKDRAVSQKRCVFSDVYNIQPQKERPPFNVYCDMKTGDGGWTVIQRRMDGSVDFYRNWRDYQYGFGNLNGEFWLGLDKISRLTEEKSCLRVDMKDFDNNIKYAHYSTFSVGGPLTGYKLTVGGYSGDAGDSLSFHNGIRFTTKDRDQDAFVNGNCAEQYKGAWWYRSCHASNLNGWYEYGPTPSTATGVVWYHFKGHNYSLKFTEMKVKKC